MKLFAALALALCVGQAGAAELLLGPGDVIKIAVYGNPDLTLETRVSDSGMVTYPLLGDVLVGGLATADAEKKISALLEKGGFLKKAQVNILVTVVTSQQVSVLGQVSRPGRYPLDSRRSVLEMLAVAGGIAPEGSDSVTLIRTRNGKTTKQVIDIVGMVRSGELRSDEEVASNDVIFVERAARFYIYGEVQRPGAFRIERDMTVAQALSMGGGLTPRGTERGIRVTRRDASGKAAAVEVKLDDLIQSDDVLYIKESLF
ncbi:polysaccharide export protein EpsE [Duganella sp. FT135W]|uniref:Polysaccharide export protein EpsE n=2 Tax=Duganella flavida TaxID=2692175 RepID=A0A6L8KKK2_9BURK|nr:polysaccharide export protein EpsE [Duganella flavida]